MQERTPDRKMPHRKIKPRWLAGLFFCQTFFCLIACANTLAQQATAPITPPIITTPPGSAKVEQTAQGTEAPAELVVSFDGLGAGFKGPQGTATLRNPSDNSLAVGPNHVMQTVNTRMAIFDKQGKVLYGPVPNNTVFKGFGGMCETTNNGDTVVRYDQLADRWLIVMPIFRRAPARPDQPPVPKASDPLQLSVPGRPNQPGAAVPLFVPQPGTDRRLDSQGDKIMARLVYRKIGNRESLVAVHSINTTAGAGGVRWYELRVNKDRSLKLHQQGTYAPDGFYRWMASPAMDKFGNIGIGYSFGGTPHFAGQRFAGRRANDPRGKLTLRETILVEGKAAQNVMRWEDYTQTAVDPSDDCTIWYVGDYLKAGETNYSTRIGAFRMPGCNGKR
jgi:hypothetical protein